MKKFIAKLSILGVGSVGALSWAMPAVAQEPSAPQTAATSTLEEIIVTANRREERLVDVPLSVTSLSGDSLTAEGLTQIQDYVTKVPGFSLQTEGRLGTRLILRGQNSGGSGASVATMADDVILNTATANSLGYTVTANFETFDMERIEVLRGPQGTLYGATAQGGLLKYITNKPKFNTFEAKGEVGFENVRYGDTGVSAKGAINLPLVQDKMALRVMGYYKLVPGYIDNTLTGEQNANDGYQYGGRASLLLAPADGLQIRLTAARQKQSYNAEGYVEVNGSPTVANLETSSSFDLVSSKPISRKRFPEENTSSYTYYNGVIDYDFGPVTLTSSTSLVKARSYYFNDITDLGLAFFGATPIIQSNNHDKFNQEVRFASKGTEIFAWQVGVFYSDEDIDFNQKIDSYDAADLSKPGFFGVLSDTKSPMTYKEFSGFGDMTIQLAENFHFSLGGRYTTNKQSWSYSYEPTLFTNFTGGTIDVKDTEESKFTYAFSPRYSINDNASVYVRVASGYRPGGPIPKFSPNINYPRDEFDADTTLNYEVGLKGTSGDSAFAYDVALYRIDWKDIQIVTSYVDTVTNITYTAIGNGGTARSEGLEWAFIVKLAERLTLGVSGAYTDARLTEDAKDLGGYDGDALPYVPKLSNAVTADYATPLNDETTLNFGASWAYVDSRYSNFASDANKASGISSHVLIPDYHTFDVRAGLEFANFRIDAAVRNLTDARGITSYSNRTGYQNQGGQANIIQPRTISLRLSTSF